MMKLMRLASWCMVRQQKSVPCLACHRQQLYSTMDLGDTNSQTEKKYYPRRAIMYIPVNDKRKVAKIPTLNVDCVVLDCEDGVAQNKKTEARVGVMETLSSMDFGSTECAVRLNSLESKMFFDDLEAVSLADNPPNTIMVPKVNSPTEASKILEGIMAHFHNIPQDKRLSVILFIESSMGLLNMQQICDRAVTMSFHSPILRMAGLVFGSDDFCADIGAKRSTDASELLYARQKFVTCAKAFRLQAIDMVHIDYKDLDGLHEQSILGANMGFTGKQVIHPTQIPVVQKAFSPSPEQTDWAYSLIWAFEEHQEFGKGAFTFQGKMIDMPLLLQAKNIVQLAEKINPRSDKTLQ